MRLSHVALWRKAVETEGWLLITEDDCRFDKRWTPGSPAYLWRTHVPSDAELVYLGPRFSDRVSGTHCYVAGKFLDALPVARPVDVWLQQLVRRPESYCVIQPGGGWQHAPRSGDETGRGRREAARARATPSLPTRHIAITLWVVDLDARPVARCHGGASRGQGWWPRCLVLGLAATGRERPPRG